MIVIDTSVALKWSVSETGSDDALKLISRSLIAPDLLQAELGNALGKKVRKREVSALQARDAFKGVADYISLLPSPAFAHAAFELALRLRHSIYDCYFLALAEAQGIFLITADRRFVAKVRGSELAPLILLLGEEVPHA